MNKLWQILGVVAFWLCFPALIIYLRRTERTRIAVIAGDRLLVTKPWLGPGTWSLPGGGLRNGEAPLAGLLREVVEEVGIYLAASEVKPLVTEPYHYWGARFTCHYFLIHISEPLPLVREHYEIADLGWVTISELHAKNSGPDVRRVLQLIATQQ